MTERGHSCPHERVSVRRTILTLFSHFVLMRTRVSALRLMYDILDQIKTDLSRLDRKAVVALCYTALATTGIFYLKNELWVASLLAGTGFEDLCAFVLSSSENNLPTLRWWVLVSLVFYFVVPALIIKFGWRQDLSD